MLKSRIICLPVTTRALLMATFAPALSCPRNRIGNDKRDDDSPCVCLVNAVPSLPPPSFLPRSLLTLSHNFKAFPGGGGSKGSSSAVQWHANRCFPSIIEHAPPPPLLHFTHRDSPPAAAADGSESDLRQRESGLPYSLLPSFFPSRFHKSISAPWAKRCHATNRQEQSLLDALFRAANSESCRNSDTRVCHLPVGDCERPSERAVISSSPLQPT